MDSVMYVPQTMVAGDVDVSLLIDWLIGWSIDQMQKTTFMDWVNPTYYADEDARKSIAAILEEVS